MSNKDTGFAYWREARGIYALRSPSAAARFGIRELFGSVGAKAVGTLLAPMLFYILVPLIRWIMDQEYQARLQKIIDKLEYERKRQYRIMYASVIN